MAIKAYPHILLLVLLLAVSCKQRKEQPPVPEEIMGKVMVDIQLAEAYSLGLSADKDSTATTRYNKNADSLYAFYSAILNHYHLNYQDFQGAIAWYKSHPDDMDSLLNKTLEELNRQKAESGITERMSGQGATAQAESEDTTDSIRTESQPLKETTQ